MPEEGLDELSSLRSGNTHSTSELIVHLVLEHLAVDKFIEFVEEDVSVQGRLRVD